MDQPTMRITGNFLKPGTRLADWPRPMTLAVLSAVWILFWSSLLGPAVPPALGQPRKAEAERSKTEMAKAEVIVGEEVIRVDVADTPSLQSKGLGGRKRLAPNAGMLFVYTEKGRHAFWMRGMYIPIDIIWLDNRRVVHIERDVPPPPPGTPESKLTTYASPSPANLVLELAAGRAKSLGLKLGSQVTFRFNVP